MNKLWGHFKTITAHKLAVTKLCFRCGLYKQGLLHDLSKYTPVEFCAGVKYFQGNRSPIDYEKEVKGYSLGWLHHKGRNKHQSGENAASLYCGNVLRPDSRFPHLYEGKLS